MKDGITEWNFQRVVKVRPLENTTLYVEFEDGKSGQVCLKDLLDGPVFQPLKDPEFFRQVFIEESGAPCWPNGVDLAPDALYEDIQS